MRDGEGGLADAALAYVIQVYFDCDVDVDSDSDVASASTAAAHVK